MTEHYYMKNIFFFLVIIFLSMNVINGSQLGIGLPWNDIHFWRYWQSENGILNEKMLILNERNESISASFMIARVVDEGMLVKSVTDSSLGIVGGPWQIPAHGYHIVSMPLLADSIKNGRLYLYRVICSTSNRTGLMYILHPKPNGNFPQNRIITTMGNGNFWWEHSSIFAVSGEKVSVRLTFIPKSLEDGEKENNCYIQYNDPSYSLRKGFEKHLKLLKVESGNLPIVSNKIQTTKYWLNSQIITIPPSKDNHDYKETYSVDFILETRQTSYPEMQYYNVQIVRGQEGGYWLDLIVLPK